MNHYFCCNQRKVNGTGFYKACGRFLCIWLARFVPFQGDISAHVAVQYLKRNICSLPYLKSPMSARSSHIASSALSNRLLSGTAPMSTILPSQLLPVSSGSATMNPSAPKLRSKSELLGPNAALAAAATAAALPAVSTSLPLSSLHHANAEDTSQRTIEKNLCVQMNSQQITADKTDVVGLYPCTRQPRNVRTGGASPRACRSAACLALMTMRVPKQLAAVRKPVARCVHPSLTCCRRCLAHVQSLLLS